MKAFLSGPNEYGTANVYRRHCAVERAFPVLSQNAGATEAWAEGEGRLALAEAKRILAETEPEPYDATLSNFRSTRYLALTYNPSMVACRLALAEALAGFLEG